MGGQIISYGSGGRPEFYEPANTSGVALSAGQPIARDGAGSGVVRAQGTAIALACVGFPEAAIGIGGSGIVRTDGDLTLADWTAATGAAALTPGAIYYLSATVAQITTVPLSTPGQVHQEVGRAATTTKLTIELSEPVLL